MVEFFHLNPRYFPESTRNHLPLDTILRLGALPLGTKHGWRFFKKAHLLNVGFVNPRNRSAVKEVRRLLTGSLGIDGIQVYRLDAAEFLQILAHSYGQTRDKLIALPTQALDPGLKESLVDQPSPDATS